MERHAISKFRFPSLPREIYDLIVHHVEDLKFEDSSYSARPDEVISTIKRQDLANLRLVSRDFGDSASRRLFRVVDANFHAGLLGDESRDRALARLHELSRSKYASFVRQVFVGVNWLSGPMLEDDGPALRAYIEDFEAVLPACLNSFHGLSRLAIYAPRTDNILNCFDFLPEDPWLSLGKTVKHALLHIPLPELTDLRLVLPGTYSFASLVKSSESVPSTPCRMPLENVMNGLRHLDVCIINYSNLPYRMESVTEIEQASWNAANDRDFFRFIQMASRLESIRIEVDSCEGGFSLDIDSLDILKVQHLCNLELLNITISSETFLQIIEQHHRSLRAIDLFCVELKDGTWEAILLRLCSLPCLLYFQVSYIGYIEVIRLAQASDLSVHGIDNAENEDILSFNFQDFYALGKLQRMIKANREAAGLCPMMDQDMKRIHLVSNTTIG
ncbi:MAG: hypothetical protein Q9187_002834 [Circinaria calcarea]